MTDQKVSVHMLAHELQSGMIVLVEMGAADIPMRFKITGVMVDHKYVTVFYNQGRSNICFKHDESVEVVGQEDVA